MNKCFNKVLHIIRKNISIIIYSILESFLQVYGFILSKNISLSKFSLKYIVLTVLLSLFFIFLNYYYWKYLNRKIATTNKRSSKKFQIIICFSIFIFISWIPVLFAYYPTIWSYDTFCQVPHLLNKPVLSVQPITHTLLIELFLIIGKKIHTFQLGMFLLSLFQMIIVALIFSYAIFNTTTKIQNKRIYIGYTIMLIIYYGFIPFNSSMAISITKDVFFAGFILLTILFLYDFLYDKASMKKIVAFSIISILTLLIKNNYVIIFLISTILFTIKQKSFKTKNIGLICTISLGIYFCIYIILIIFIKPYPTPKFEKYSLPEQNLFYVIHSKKTNINNSNINKVLGFEKQKCLKTSTIVYNKHLSDPVKEKLKQCASTTKNEILFLQTWLKYGIKYPIDYIDSSANLSIGSWYLLDETHAHIYKDYGYLLTKWNKVKTISMKKPKSKLPKLYSILELFNTKNIQYSKLSFLRFIFQPATYILSFFSIVTFLISNKRKKEIIPLIPLIILFFALITSPAILVRYVYPYMVCIPIIFIKISTNNHSN